MISDDDLFRYSRQIIMPEIGEEGQELISSSKIAIIGAGGLGCPVGLYLAGAGVGQIYIYDNDKIDVSNLNRQIAFSNDDVNQKKSLSLKKTLSKLNPKIQIHSFNDSINKNNIDLHLNNFDIVVDCTDNFETRHLLAEKCYAAQIPMSFGAAVRQEGQTAFFQAGCINKTTGKTDSNFPCYGCLFPKKPADSLLPRCSEAGILGPITGIIASIQSLNVIRFLTNQKISENLILWDGVSFFEVKIKKQKNCKICG